MKNRLALGVPLICLLTCISCCKESPEAKPLKIEPSCFVCLPGQTLSFSLSENTLTDGSIVWYVNGEVQPCNTQTFELQTLDEEKRYRVCARYSLGDTFLSTDTVTCYGTRDAGLLKVIYDYIDKYDYEAAISVSVRGNDYSYVFADGCASVPDGIRNTLTTPHILYSITKSFVAAAVLNLCNEGCLSMEDAISDFNLGLNPIYVNNDATIGELLTHRSGISDYTSNPYLFYDNPFSHGNPWNPIVILDYIQTPAAARGSMIYSSANYIILGLIVEAVSGVSLNSYLCDHFLSPLGLAGLKLAPQDSVEYEQLAHPHAYPGTFMNLVGDGQTLIDITDVIDGVCELLAKCSWAAGGMVGTADQVSAWGYHLLGNEGLVNRSIRDAIVGSLENFNEDNSPTSAYGIATRKLFRDSKVFIGSYGRSIGDENLMFYNLDKDVCIVILTSSDMNVDGSPNIDDLMFAIYDAL